MSIRLAERVAGLEADVAELKRLVKSLSMASEPAADAWRVTVGAFRDDTIYDDAARLGQSWRRRQPKC